MYATIQIYPMAGQAGRFAVHRAELERLMRDVPGLVSYHLLETREGLAAMVVCRERAGCEVCARRATAWIEANLPDLARCTPLVVDGEVIAEAAALERT